MSAEKWRVQDALERAERRYAQRHPVRIPPSVEDLRDFHTAIRCAALALVEEMERESAPEWRERLA